MPWRPDNAREHTRKADTGRKKRAWSKIANEALKSGKSEAAAIRIANAAVKKVGKGKK